MSPDLAILTPVYQPYGWLAPVLRDQLARCWPGHPPLWVAGLTADEAGDLPALPLSDAGLPRDWCVFMREACTALLARGITRCYLIPEEHPPLELCHATHLNETLPALMDELGAAYIALLGWDHRRAVHRGTPVRDGLRRLDGAAAPRFQLHPALWRVEALAACLDAALALSNHSPWGFENTAKRPDAPLPPEYTSGCYAIEGAAMSLHPPGTIRQVSSAVKHWIGRRLIGLAGRLPDPLRRRFWEALRFDHFAYNGPYPMYFGGVMTRGKVNQGYCQHTRRVKQCAPLMEAIRVHVLNAT